MYVIDCNTIFFCSERRHGGIESCSSSSKWLSNAVINSTSTTTTTMSSSSSHMNCQKESRDKPLLVAGSRISSSASSVTSNSLNNHKYIKVSGSSNCMSASTHPSHPSHVPPASSGNSYLSHHHHHNNSFSPLLAALNDPQSLSSSNLGGSNLSFLPSSVSSGMLYSATLADTSIRISLPTTISSTSNTNSNLNINTSNTNSNHLSSSTSSRNTSRCSSSNSLSLGSNSTISNNLELGITNGVDFNPSGPSSLLDDNIHSRITMSPALDFPSPSACSLSKDDDEDSLDSRLRALHSPSPSVPINTTSSSTLVFHCNNNTSALQNHLSISDLTPDNNTSSILNSSQYNSQNCSGSHVLGTHSVGPPSVGPPSVGPPSVGPPSIGPPSIGPLSVGSQSLSCPPMGSLSGVSMNNVSMVGSLNGTNGRSSSSLSSSGIHPVDQEAVQRISQMLQKEAEAISNNSELRSGDMNASNTLSLHDFVEAQGLAGSSHLANALSMPLNVSGISSRSNNSDNSLNITSHSTGHEMKGHMDSSDVSSLSSMPSMTSRQMSHLNSHHLISSSHPIHNNIATVSTGIGQVPVETLNQIQAELLATVSESDLNAVLNATPDASLLNNNSSNINNNMLEHNNSSQVYFPDNTTVEFRDSNMHSSTNFESLNSDSSLSQQHCNREQMNLTVSEHVGGGSSSVNTPTFHYDSSNLLDQSIGHQISKLDNIAHSDELASAVNSITQNSASSSFDSQMSGFLHQHHQQQLPTSQCSTSHFIQQVAPSPVPSPSPSISVGLACSSPLSVSSVSSLPLAPINIGSNVQDMAGLGQSVVTSQGITVVIGGTATPITLPQSPVTSLAAIKKSTPPSGILSQRLCSAGQSPNITLSQSPLHSTTPVHAMSQSGLTTPPHTTPSPKKSSKKKGSVPRKVVPLKDREYNPEKHCGVVVAETGKPCTRSLTCKTHSLTLRRAVNSRSKKFDDLLLEHKNNKVPKPLDSTYPVVQVRYAYSRLSILHFFVLFSCAHEMFSFLVIHINTLPPSIIINCPHAISKLCIYSIV